jgi:AcrR family transcriptional regulator
MEEAGKLEKKRTRMRSEERRALILKSAKQVFAQHSYAEASTSLLAKESGVTEPMLYRHFDSKKDLFLAVLREYSLSFLQQWQERLAEREQKDLLDALLYVVLDYRDIMSSDPDIHRVLHQAVAEVSDPEFGTRVATHNNKVAASITELLTRAQQASMLEKDVDVGAAVWGYLSMIYTMQYSYVLHIEHQLSSEVLLKMSLTWLRGLLSERYRNKLSLQE